MIITDQALRGLSGHGARDLQGAHDAAGFDAILGAFAVAGPRATILAGFSLGFDYLFMAAYGFAFVCAVLFVRDRLFPDKGPLRATLNAVALLTIVGVLLDGFENILELRIAISDQARALAQLASAVTLVKWIASAPSMLLTVVAIVLAFLPRRNLAHT
jgi:hypothetical protein